MTVGIAWLELSGARNASERLLQSSVLYRAAHAISKPDTSRKMRGSIRSCIRWPGETGRDRACQSSGSTDRVSGRGLDGAAAAAAHADHRLVLPGRAARCRLACHRALRSQQRGPRRPDVDLSAVGALWRV